MTYKIPLPITLKKYGMSVKEWKTLLDKLGNFCSYCQKPPKEKSLSFREGKLFCQTCLMVEARLGKKDREERKRLKRGTSKCIRCDTIKPLEDFPISRKKRDGNPRYAYCKVCHGEYQRKQRMKRFFNLTIEDYNTIFKHQDGRCAICLKEPILGVRPSGRKRLRLAVDHDHKTGLIRGLLCMWCNRATGFFRDDVKKVRRVYKYFKSPPATEALGSPRFGLKGRVSNKAKTRKRLNKDTQ